nr:hypothetical protein [Tanacetum cinerariifolium]
MAANENGDNQPPPKGGDLPVLDLRTMEKLCQPTLNGRGGPIAPIAIQATNFGLKNDMIQQGKPAGGSKKNPRVQSPLGMIYSELVKLTHAVNQQTSVVTTAMTAMLKQFQSNPPPAQVKAVEEICVTCRATGNYNQGNPDYRPQGVANQMRPPCFAQPNCMSTRSPTRNLFPPLENPELTIQRRTRVDPSLLNNFEEINIAANENGDNQPPPKGGDLPVPDLRTMEKLCQPTLNGRGGPIAPIAIQATNFGLKNDMIQQVKDKQENDKIKTKPDKNGKRGKPRKSTMTDNRTMAEMLRAPTEGCAEAIVVPSILAEQFELKHSLINMMTSEQFFGLEKDNPHDHIRWGSPPVLEKEPPRSITTWDDLVSKFINEFFPPSRTTNLRNEILNFQQKFDESFHEAWERYKDLIRACPHHGFTELRRLDTFYSALNPADQDSLNAAAGGNLLDKSPQDALTIIENKSKVRNSRSKPIASPINACDNESSSEIAKLTHAVNQQTSAVTTAMTAMLKQLQANPPPDQVKAVEEICVTCRGDHPYYQCLAARGNTFLEFRDNIQGYVSAATGNYNQGNPGYRPQGVANQIRPPGSGSLSGNTVANRKGELKAITTRSGLITDGPTVPTPSKSVNPEEDECVDETYTDPDLAKYTIKVPPPPVQKPKPPIQRHFVLHTRDSPLSNIPYPSRMLKQKKQDELNCKALADLGAVIKLMPLFVWKKLSLPDLILTRMTLKLANHAICTPDGIARDVFVPVGKFTFLADFVVVDYESDPRVPLILGRPFLRTARALIDVPDEEMILRDGDEMLTLNMKHDTTSYSNHPHRESANLINIFNLSSEDCLEVLVSNKQSGNPTFSLHKEIASPKVTHEIYDSEGSNSLLKEFTDELALITYPPDYDDNLTCDIESDLREIEFLLYQGEDSDFKDSIDQTDLANRDDLFVDPTPKMFTDEQPPDYSFPPRFNMYPDDFLEIESDANNSYDDFFDSKGEKIKESELLIDQLDLPCDIHSEYDSFNSQDFYRDDDLPFPDNEDKVFNLGILIHEKSVTIITRVAQEKKLAISYASLLFEDFDPPFYKLLVFKEVPNSMRLLPFSSENEEKVFKPGIYNNSYHSSVRCALFKALYRRKCMVRFGKKGKLAPRFVGPFEITEQISLVAYRLRLPKELNEPMEILEREFKKLKRSRISIIKVQWNSKRGPDFT